MKNEEEGVFVFGIPLSNRLKWQQLLLCSSGFFFGYLLNAICQEYVYIRLQFSCEWYFTFVQGLVYVCLINFLSYFAPKPMLMVNQWKIYLQLYAILMCSHRFTKWSLAFLNYPAKIMSKLVLPVTIMGTLIPSLRRKCGPPHGYIPALLLAAGLLLFTLADAQTSCSPPNFTVIDVLKIYGALVMDTFSWIGIEVMIKLEPDMTQLETFIFSTISSITILIPALIGVGEVSRVWISCAQHPYVYGVLAFVACASLMGKVSVLSLTVLLGAATTAMPLTDQHGSGLLLISMGIIMKMLPDNKPLQPHKTSPTENDPSEFLDEEKRHLV